MKKLTIPAKYGELTPPERRKVRERYCKLQDWKCHHCKAPLDGEPASHIKVYNINMDLFPKGFLDHKIHLHHSHETGLTIGAVHARCNAVLWQYHGE